MHNPGPVSHLHFHHTGCLVNDLEQAIENYKVLLPNVKLSPVYTIETQKVKLVFLQLNGHVYLELIECLEGNITLDKLRKKGTNFYHIAFSTNGTSIDT